MRILFAWETGNNASPAAIMAGIARAMYRRKAYIFFAARQPAALIPHLDGMRYELFQAPQVQGRARGAPLIYPDTLRGAGYDDPKILAGQIVAWRALFTAIKPDVLVAMRAPTALLAARPYKFKKVAVGSGCDIPPASHPMPLMQYWEKFDSTVLDRRESAVISVINEALGSLNLARLKSFSEMMKVNKEYLTTFEELDHYPERNADKVVKANYVGPFYTMESGKSVAWSKEEKTARVFASLQAGAPGASECLKALQAAPKEYEVIAAVPGLPEKIAKQVEKPNLRVFTEPVRLDKLIKKCDLGIGHASAGISSAFALNGVPQLMLPGTAEQMMFARAIGRAKAGLGLAGKYGPNEAARMIRTAVDNAEIKAGAGKLAAKYKDFDPAQLADSIAADINRLAG